MLDINPLLVISFANIFSQSVDFFSFALQQLLRLIRSLLFVFAFVSFGLGDGF